MYIMIGVGWVAWLWSRVKIANSEILRDNNNQYG